MKSVRVIEVDIRLKLPEANVTQLSTIKAVVFETTGNLAVIHSSDEVPIDELYVGRCSVLILSNKTQKINLYKSTNFRK